MEIAKALNNPPDNHRCIGTDRTVASVGYSLIIINILRIIKKMLLANATQVASNELFSKPPNCALSAAWTEIAAPESRAMNAM